MRQHQIGGEVSEDSISLVHDEGGTRPDIIASPLSRRVIQKSRSVASIKAIFSNEEGEGGEQSSGGTSTLLNQKKNEITHTFKSDQKWYQKLQLFQAQKSRNLPKYLDQA